jgi:hypothetical protein
MTEMETEQKGIGHEIEGKFYTFFVDGVEFHSEKPALTGLEIMNIAGIPPATGLLLIQEDGTQVQVAPNEIIELKPGRRFKKAPRFVRG